MDFKALYADKQMTAAQAAALVQSGDWVDYGWTANTPVAVDAELLIDHAWGYEPCGLAPVSYTHLGKGGLLWTVKSGKSLDLQGSASPQPCLLYTSLLDFPF